MILTLTDSDIQSIVRFYADKGVPLAPALMGRMSGEQIHMAATIMHEAAARDFEHTDEFKFLRGRKTKR